MFPKPSRHGAMTRAYFTAALLVLVSLFVIAPHAHAATDRVAWAAIPGDAYRADANHGHPGESVAVAAHARASFAGILSRGAVAALVRAKAEAVGVPVRLALAIAHFESGFRMVMQGAAGERGAMQVLPQTARQVGITGNLYGPAGVEAGVRYLKLAVALHGRAGWCAVASAYNMGVWRDSHCTAYGRLVAAMAARR